MSYVPKNLRVGLELWGYAPWDQNDPFVLNKDFLVQTIVITFIYLLVLFIVQNIKKPLQRIQNYDDAQFLGPKWSIYPKQVFLENYYHHSHLRISPFHCAKFEKKFFQRIQSYEDVQFLGPKWPISPIESFSRKTVNEPCFFYPFLSTCQKSNSGINLLKKYFGLNNTEISLDESHFCFYLEN